MHHCIPRSLYGEALLEMTTITTHWSPVSRNNVMAGLRFFTTIAVSQVFRGNFVARSLKGPGSRALSLRPLWRSCSNSEPNGHKLPTNADVFPSLFDVTPVTQVRICVKLTCTRSCQRPCHDRVLASWTVMGYGWESHGGASRSRQGLGLSPSENVGLM